MMLGDAVDVIRAYYLEARPLEWNDNGKWKPWYGNTGELFDWLKDGRIFRVKRVPVECWIIRPNADGRPLTGNMVYRTREEAERAADDIGWQAVLMREVLQ